MKKMTSPTGSTISGEVSCLLSKFKFPFPYLKKRIPAPALLLAFLSLSLLTACEEGEPVPTTGFVTANAGPDQTVLVGQLVSLDASASQDSRGQAMHFNWTTKTKPAGSNATLSNPGQVKPGFVADLVGEYTFEVTVTSSSGQHKDLVQISATTQGPGIPVVLNSPITSDRTLPNTAAAPSQPDYLVTENIQVSARLTIEPGVIIAFEADKGLEITPQGALLARGSETQKVVFTGTTKAAGFWKGILFNSNNPLNELNYVEVNYGGSSTMTDMPVHVKTNVGITGTSSTAAMVRISNSTFSNANGYGLFVMGQLAAFSNNTFRENTSLPLYIIASQVHKLDANSAYAGAGGIKGIGVSGTVPSLTTGVTWPRLLDGTKYWVIEPLDIAGGVSIAPGVVMEFSAGVAFTIREGGYLTAKGTAADRITFTGIQKTKGYWKGVVIRSASNLNELDHVDVAFAGHSPTGNQGQAANVVVWGDPATPGAEGSLKVSNSSFSHSGAYGMVIQSEGGYLSGFAQNTFSYNTAAAMWIDANEIHKLDPASRLNSHNGYNGLETKGTLSQAQEVSWPVFTDDARYYITDDLVLNSGLRISNAKATHALFEFAADKGCYVQGNGYLHAQGNGENALVLFTGKIAAPGSWKGMLIASKSPRNQLTFTGFNFGGSNELAGLDDKASLGVLGMLSLSNSSIRNSGGYGLYAKRRATLNPDAGTVNTFLNNAKADYHQE